MPPHGCYTGCRMLYLCPKTSDSKATDMSPWLPDN